MRVSASRGTVFSYVFLSIFALSHAFVFWIPVWKTTSVLRYHPKKGWTPIKTRGSGIFKPKHNYNFYSPSHHKKPHHFYSTYTQQYRYPRHPLLFTRHHHSPFHSVHKYKHWKPVLKKSPLLDLNHHHPLCPLCHLAEYWHKPRKPLYGGHGFFHNHHRHKNNFFSPSDIFPRANLHQEFSHFPKLKHPFPSFDFPSGPSHFPKFPKFNGFPKESRTPHKFSSHFSQGDLPKYPRNHGYSYPKQHYKPHYHDDHHHYPTKTHRHRQQSKQVSYKQNASPSGNYVDEIDYSKINDAPIKASAPVQPKLQFPKDFSNFGFSEFASGQKGHGWNGWDW